MEFEPRELLDSEKAADLFSDYEGGYPRKDYNTLQEIWCDVMSPFIDLLTKKARVAGITHGVKGTVVRFLLFRVLLGMIQPRRIDDVWVPKALSYNARLSQLLTRREYYRLNRELQVYKNPRVGHKPPRVVPLLSNCGFPQEVVVHKKRGYEMPAIIGCYRALAGGVDTANQLALQHRETGRFRKWSAAVRSFLMRYAMVNIFTMAKCSKLVKPGTTMWEFQWDLLTTLIDIEVPETPQAIHVPVEANRAACVHCGKRCATQCAACRQNLHVRCFAQWHLNQ